MRAGMALRNRSAAIVETYMRQGSVGVYLCLPAGYWLCIIRPGL